MLGDFGWHLLDLVAWYHRVLPSFTEFHWKCCFQSYETVFCFTYSVGVTEFDLVYLVLPSFFPSDRVQWKCFLV